MAVGEFVNLIKSIDSVGLSVSLVVCTNSSPATRAGQKRCSRTISETMQTCTGFYQSLRQPESNSHWIQFESYTKKQQRSNTIQDTKRKIFIKSHNTSKNIRRPTTIGNLGLWTRLGIPTRAARLKTHHLVRFFVGFSCSFDFWIGRNTHAGRAVFILFGARKRNPIPPHAQKTPKTVMQSAIACAIICGK